MGGISKFLSRKVFDEDSAQDSKVPNQTVLVVNVKELEEARHYRQSMIKMKNNIISLFDGYS